MEGIITKGTTLAGRAVNAGDRVEVSADDFQKLRLTGDIEPIPEPATQEETDSKPARKKK